MRAPPAWAMPAAAAIVALFLLAMVPAYLEDNRLGAGGVWTQLVAEAIQRTSRTPPPDATGRTPLTVLAVGTSLMTCATAHNGEMEKLARVEGKRPLRYRKLCGGGANWDPLPMLEAACATRTQVLLVEGSMLFQRNREMYVENAGLASFLDYVRFRVQAAFDFSGHRHPPRWPVEILPRASEYPRRQLLTPDRVEQTLEHQRRTFHPGDVDRYVRTFRDARDAGTIVVLLDLALPSLPVPYTDDEMREIAAAYAKLKAEAGIRVWTPPVELLPPDYYDERHLAPTGREKVSRWLAAQLDELPIP